MQETKSMLKILFLCTGNSCRSQMAEGWARHLKGDLIDAYSAGIETHGLNPNAVKVMTEAGVDISRQSSKGLDELSEIKFDYVITVCGHADENCPMFSGETKVVHVGFDDPPKLAQGAKTEEEALGHYRRVRDEIKALIGRAFQVDTKGRINVRSMLTLRQFKFDDPVWQIAMDLIADSLRVKLTRRYINIYERNEHTGRYEILQLNWSSAMPGDSETGQ